MQNIISQAKSLLNKIKKQTSSNKYSNYILASLVILLAIFRELNILFLVNIIFILYIFISSIIWSNIFKKIFKRNKNIVDYIYGLFISFLLPVIFSSIFIIYGYINNVSWFLIFAISSLVTILFSKKYKSVNLKEEIVRSKVLFRKNILPIAITVILAVIAFVLMVPGSLLIFSPWAILPVEVIYIIFALLIISGGLIYSQWSYKYILILLMLVSFVLHLNLAKSHEYPWGGDVWRMIGIEERIADQKIVEPVLFGSDIKYKNIAGVSIPEAFVIPNKYAYGHIWASVVLISEHSNFSILNINKWLAPIAWSIFVTVFLYQIGLLLFSSRRTALLLVWAGLLPFTFQVLGAITLPNSVGFIYFLFVLSILIKDAQKKILKIDWLLILLLFSSLFGYSLYAILLWVLYIGVFLFKYIELQISLEKIHIKFKALYLGLSLGLVAYLMPLIDVALKTTYISTPINLFEKLKLFVGQSSGLFISKYINNIDISSWNILFNHTPNYAFVNNIFTNFRWHILVITILILISFIFGIYKFLTNKDILNNNIKYILFMLTIISIIGYIFGWHILEGDRTFVRRLDPLVALVIIIFALNGLTSLYNNFSQKISDYSMTTKRIAYLILIIIFSWFGTTVYALGPDIRSTSQDEYIAGDFVSGLLHDDLVNIKECVVASTEILLVIESKTQANIVGGNFDIDYQFGQSERVELYNDLYNSQKNIKKISEQIFDKNRFNNCYIVLDSKKLSEERISELLDVYGDPIANNSLFSIWSAQSLDFFVENE